MTDFEFQIYYKKNNENNEVNTLSRWLDHEEMKWIYVEILFKENKILTKELAATYKVENASLIDD